MGKKDETTPAAGGRRLTPVDIQQKEFAVSRLGGYRMRDVDEYLDELTESVTELMAELEQARAVAGQGPVLGSPDLDDVSRQADEIIQRARDEANRIVADAQERGPSAPGAAAVEATSDARRAAVDAFLRQEREFLQSLAALVQGHAESVKGMVREARSARVPAPAADASPPERAAAAEPAEPAADQAEKPGSPQEADRRPKAQPDERDEPARGAEPGGDVTQVIDAPKEPIRVDEPEPAAASKERGETDPTLRELFWGEEN